MPREQVEYTATAKDKASPVLKKLQNNVNALGTAKLGPLGRLTAGLGGLSPVGMAAALGVGALTVALADGVAGALEEEKQLGRLDQALQANIKGWDGNREAIDRATDAAMDLAFSDDEAREAMIKLVTATGDVNKSLSHTRLAMDIARGRNIDLATATDIVIKANMGNVGALRRMGIELDATATKTEILATLQGRYAGQAAAYAQSTAGQFEAAQKKVDNAMEGVGHAIIESGAAWLEGWDMLMYQLAPDYQKALGAMMVGSIDKGSRAAVQEAVAAGESIAESVSSAFAMTIRQRERDFAAAGDAIRENLGNLSPNIVGSLRGGGIKDIMKDLNWAINHPEKLAKFGEKLQDALANPKLQAALGSNNPFLVLAGQQAQTALGGLWTSITGGADTSRSAVDQLAESIRRLGGAAPAPLFGVFGGNPYRPGQIPARAAGGPVESGQTYLVGEKGPEILRMGTSGHVTPNSQLGGSIPPINVYVDGKQLFQIMDERMGRRLSRTPAGVVNRG